MKKYEDKTIIIRYPEDFKLRVKKKWCQYDLKKKLGQNRSIIIFLQIVPGEMLGSFERVVRYCPFDEFNVGKFFETVEYGRKKGIGHVVTMNDFDNNFVQKRYRYLFSVDTRGLYIEVIGEEYFEIETYKEILELIQIKE